METMTKENTLLQSQLLDMGWTKTMIQRYLPAPVEKRNRQYPHSAPYKLYDKAVVLATMETDAFKAAMAKVEKRRQTERDAIKARYDEIESEIHDVMKTLSITILPDEELIRSAIQWRRDILGKTDKEIQTVSEDVLAKWIVSYITNHLISENHKLFMLEARYSAYDYFQLYKRQRLMLIADAYPKYSEECNRMIKETYEYSNPFYSFVLVPIVFDRC